MKRSVAIKAIADRLQQSEIPEPYMHANDILDILERRLKMLPPLNKWILNETENTKIYEWENEDVSPKKPEVS